MSDRQAPVCGGSEKEKERRFHAALRTASNILGYAECSPARLREKLSVRGYERELIDAVLDRLRGAGLLDEDAMARRKAEMLCRVKGYGPRRILPELRRLGFSSAVIDEVEQKVAENMTTHGRGSCHERWALTREYLEEKGVEWRSQGVMNPGWRFD